MRNAHEIKASKNQDLFVDLVNNDPQHISRAKEKAKRVRKERQTMEERALQYERSRRADDRREFSRKVTRMKLDNSAATASIAAASLFAGYILALL